MRDMNVQHHLVVDEVAVTADVTAADEIDPETEDDPEAMIVEEVDHVADQIDEAVAVIEAEKEEVDPIVGQIVTVVAVTTNQQANQDPAQDPDPHPDRKLPNCPFWPMPKYDSFILGIQLWTTPE